jgi:hypothetical protein
MGKYQYLWLHMGITNSPDIFQAVIAVIMDVLGNLEYALTYINDILITSLGSLRITSRDSKRFYSDSKPQVSKPMYASAFLPKPSLIILDITLRGMYSTST